MNFQKKELIIISGIVLIFLFRCFSGIYFLLPYFELGPDERIFVEHSLQILKTGDFNPHYFTYGSLLFYLTVLVYIIYFGVRSLFGPYSFSELLHEASFSSDGFSLLLLGRFTSIAFGIGSVLLTYYICKIIHNRETGFLAALLLALNPFNIVVSQSFKTDSSLIFFILASFLFSLQVFRFGKIWNYVWAGVFSGLALSTKFQFLAFAPVVAAHFLRSANQSSGHKKHSFSYWIRISFHPLFLLSAYAALAVFIFTSPFVILEMKTALHSLSLVLFSNREVHVFQANPDSFFYSKLFHQLILLFPFVYNPIIFLSSFLGLYNLFKNNFPYAILILSFLLPYLLISTLLLSTFHFQYYLPMYPFLVITASHALILILRQYNRFAKISGIIFLFLSISWFIFFWAFPSFPSHSRVYVNTGKWIEENISKTDSMLFHSWLFPPTERLRYPRGKYFYYRRVPFLEDIRLSNPDYVVLTFSSFFQDPRWLDENDDFLLLYRAFTEGNFSGYELVRSFGPSKSLQVISGIVFPDFRNFEIRIYRKINKNK